MVPLKREATTGSTVPYSIFTGRQRVLIVCLVSIAATFTSISSNIYFPAIPTIASALRVSNEDVDLTVTTYMIFQGLSPSIWGAVSDAKGRRFTYMLTFVIYLGACIGLAETKHYYQLVILRCLQSSGSASTVAIGSGVIGDITQREERGGFMGIFQAGLLAPLAIGPVLGGIFAETLGWRSIFWFLTIYAAVFLLFLVILLPETLRSLVGNGSIPAKGLAKSPIAHFQRKRAEDVEMCEETPAAPNPDHPRIDVFGPFRILFTKDLTCVIFFLSILYTGWQITVTGLPTLFKRHYDLSEISIGLTFIANGVGCMLGTLLTGKLLDFEYRKVKAAYTGEPARFPLDHARLRLCTMYALIQCAATIVFGWTLQYKVHISVPVIATFFIGWASTSVQSAITTYLVDVFPKASASATAASNLCRCLLGAGGTAAVLPIIDAIGDGWTYTLMTGIMMASMGLLVLQMRCGMEWRIERERRLAGR